MDFPNPIDTRSRQIEKQEKRKYYFDQQGISVDNLFDGARLNHAVAENDSTIRLIISPENQPINPSPWYAFRAQALKQDKVYFHIDYGTFKHRYHPKVSRDLKTWIEYDTTLINYNSDSTSITFPILIDQNRLWIAANEIVSSHDVKDWCNELSDHADVKFSVVGKTKSKRDLFMIDIGRGNNVGKPLIIILSRQHPPEVTGYFAMQHFINRITSDDSLAKQFRDKYRMIVFPLMNPDGVDEGHWRHNMGGIDLNRDWAYYRQPETRQVANRIASESKKSQGKVIIGMDFHSTWYDVYYTNKETVDLTLPDFKKEWLTYIEKHLENYELDERPSNVGQPVSKGWFYSHFRAVGLTYEIGDSTPRDFIRQKGITSAEGLMKILLNTESSSEN